MTYYNIVKEYPDMYRIVSYKHGFTPKEKDTKNKLKKIVEKFEQNYFDSSIARTRRVLTDYVLCNDFDLFVTFTFSPRKVNRYDMQEVYPKMQSWLWRQQRKNPDLKYIIVPERHKDGALHFHALFQSHTFTLKKTNVVQDGRRVHNITAFRFGFTNGTYLKPDEREKAANYICKYLSKDMIILPNKRRYWCSKGLLKPITTYNDARFNREINQHSGVLLTETEFNLIYQVPKELLD